MKKAVVTILLVLPFVLMIIISFAAKIVSNHQYINVESICIVKDEKKCYNDEVLKIEKGTEYDLEVRVYPEFSTNKEVIYTSSDEAIVKVSDDGIIKGLEYGNATIRVTSKENREIYQVIDIEVRDDYVSSVELDIEEITLTIKQNYQLNASVYPNTALERTVIYSSSNPEVAIVNGNGLITAISAGEAIITATTVDGNKTDNCMVIVEDKADFGFIDYEDGKDLYILNTNIIDLNTLLEYDSEIINLDDVVYEVKFGEQLVTRNGNMVEFKQSGIIYVEAKVKGTIYFASIYLKYESN